MIKLAYSSDDQRGDFVRTDGANFDTDEGLETAVTVSLLTDARAKDDDDVDEGVDKCGWWASQYLERELGSRLWLLKREKLTDKTLQLASDYCKEALAWLTQPSIGVAASIGATAQRIPGRFDAAIVMLTIERQRKSAPRYQRPWEVQFGL